MKFFTKITSVNIVTAVFIFAQQSLVHPIPDEGTLHPWILVDRIPVFEYITVTIAHGVGIFT